MHHDSSRTRFIVHTFYLVLLILIQMSDAGTLTAAQTRQAALNRAKAKERLSRVAEPSAGSSRNGGQRGGQDLVHKPSAGPSTSRNAVEGQKGEVAPLRRDPGLVCTHYY